METRRRRFSVVVVLILALSGALFTAACGGSTTAPTQEGTVSSIRLLGLIETKLNVGETPAKIRLPYGDRYTVQVDWELSDAVWRRVLSSGSWPKMRTCQGPSTSSIGGTCEVTSLMSQRGSQSVFAGTIPNQLPYTQRDLVEMKFVHSFVTLETAVFPDGGGGEVDLAINFPLSQLTVTPVEDISVPSETTWYRP